MHKSTRWLHICQLTGTRGSPSFFDIVCVPHIHSTSFCCSASMSTIPLLPVLKDNADLYSSHWSHTFKVDIFVVLLSYLICFWMDLLYTFAHVYNNFLRLPLHSYSDHFSPQFPKEGEKNIYRGIYKNVGDAFWNLVCPGENSITFLCSWTM